MVELYTVYAVIMDSVYIILFVEGKRLAVWIAPAVVSRRAIFLDWKGGRVFAITSGSKC